MRASSNRCPECGLSVLSKERLAAENQARICRLKLELRLLTYITGMKMAALFVVLYFLDPHHIHIGFPAWLTFALSAPLLYSFVDAPRPEPEAVVVYSLCMGMNTGIWAFCLAWVYQLLPSKDKTGRTGNLKNRKRGHYSLLTMSSFSPIMSSDPFSNSLLLTSFFILVLCFHWCFAGQPDGGAIARKSDVGVTAVGEWSEPVSDGDGHALRGRLAVCDDRPKLGTVTYFLSLIS